jgi:PAS domain S-box-containing protein
MCKSNTLPYLKDEVVNLKTENNKLESASLNIIHHFSSDFWDDRIKPLLEAHWPNGSWEVGKDQKVDLVFTDLSKVMKPGTNGDFVASIPKIIIAQDEEEALRASARGYDHILCLEDKGSWNWKHIYDVVRREVEQASANLNIFDFPARVVDDFLSRSELSFCLLDERGKMRYFNHQFKSFLGYTASELLGKDFSLLLSGDIQGLAEEVFEEERDTGLAGPSKWPVKTKSGEERTILTFPHHFSDTSGNSYNLAVILEVEKLYEDYIHRDTSAEILREIASTSPVIMTIYDLERKVNVYQSRSMFEMLGYSEDFILEAKKEPESFRRKLFHEDYIREIDKYYAEVQSLRSFEKKQLIYRVRDHEDEWRWIRKITSVFKREKESVTQVLNTFEDITALKESESKIFITESRNKALITAVPDFIFRIDAKGYYLDYKGAEDKESALIKDGRVVLPDTLIGRNISEVLDADVAEDFQKAITKALDSGEVQTVSYLLDTAQGTRIFETLVNRSAPEEVICIARDITERMRQEDLLRDRLQFIEFTSQLSNDILLTDLDKVDEIIYSAIEFVCRHTKSNRGFIYTARDEQESYKLVHSWVDETTPDYIERDRMVDQSDFLPISFL